MRPVVKPALRWLWRDSTTLQIGVHPDRAVVVGGLADRAASLVGALDGTRDHESLRAAARDLGLDESVADRLLAILVDASVLDDASTDATVLARLPRRERDRLGPDLASMSLVSGLSDAGLSTVSRRQRTIIGIVGAGRVGTATATLLAAAGIGHVVVDDAGICLQSDCGPAGPAIADAGASRVEAARSAIHRVSDSTRTSGLQRTQRPDVVILAPTSGWDPLVASDMMRTGTPHVLATVLEATGVVGPFVIPGITSCLRCLDLHRTDRDPAWPMIAAQLASGGRRRPVEACDVVLATAVASLCAQQVLAFIDGTGGNAAPTQNGTLEMALPDWRTRRRSRPAHPACGCRWPGNAPSRALLTPDRAPAHP